MYKVQATVTVTDPTGHKTHRTVDMEIDDIDREAFKAFGVKVGDEASLAGWDNKLRHVKVNPVANARERMARERTHRTRGKGAASNGHGGES